MSFFVSLRKKQLALDLERVIGVDENDHIERLLTSETAKWSLLDEKEWSDARDLLQAITVKRARMIEVERAQFEIERAELKLREAQLELDRANFHLEEQKVKLEQSKFSIEEEKVKLLKTIKANPEADVVCKISQSCSTATDLGREYLELGSPEMRVVRQARVGMTLEELEQTCGPEVFRQGFPVCHRSGWIRHNGKKIYFVATDGVVDNVTEALRRALSGRAQSHHVQHLIALKLVEPVGGDQ